MSLAVRPIAPPQSWLRRVRAALDREPVAVRIVLAAVRGSAPREAGVCMVVGQRGIEGTIGGGRLEWDALAAARILLQEGGRPAVLQHVVLGADRGQCCGGVVDVWMERFTRDDLGLLDAAERAARRGGAVLESTLTPAGLRRRVLSGCEVQRSTAPSVPGVRRMSGDAVSLTEPLNDARPPVWLFGAGHVGRALAGILADLPLCLTWIDPRSDAFPAAPPAGVRILAGIDPVPSVLEAPAGTRFIIMTHSHPLDFDLCRAVLERGDFAWAGLIGSLSKSARFRSRLRREGVPAAAVSRLVCPIGIDGIDSKWPAAIAVGVAAQLLRGLGTASGDDPVSREPLPLADTVCATGDCTSCGVRA